MLDRLVRVERSKPGVAPSVLLETAATFLPIGDQDYRL
jgi:hypothetical protein